MSNYTNSKQLLNEDTIRHVLRLFQDETSDGNATDERITDETVVSNGTGPYYLDDEGRDYDNFELHDWQALLLACLATVIPLIVSVIIAFGIRIVWMKCKMRRACHTIYKCKRRKKKILQLQDKLLGNNRPQTEHGMQIEEEVENCRKTVCQLDESTDQIEEVCISNVIDFENDNTISQKVRNNNQLTTSNSQRATTINGNVFTMTLKNNHLIIETEERFDIANDRKETTMKYSPSGVKDGIFVIQVQQGSEISGGQLDDRSYSSTHVERNDNENSSKSTTSSSSPPLETIHMVPSTPLQDSSENPPSIFTGFSQSDSNLASPSSSTQHFTYCYTNQQSYNNGFYGYPVYNGYSQDSLTNPQTLKYCCSNQFSKHPVITAGIFKTDSAKSVDTCET